VGLFFVCSYSIKTLATSILMILVASKGNKTNSKMAKAIVWYISLHLAFSFLYLSSAYSQSTSI
jgi:hypothetical protein